MKKNKYRLENFIITEYDNFFFTWETHLAIGAQRSGNCFIIGDILVIDRWDHEAPGYLILEFHEQLMKLPVWNKTRYYCLSSSLHAVDSGHKPLKRFYLQQIAERIIGKGPLKIPAQGTFRLGQYKITVEENSSVSWQAYEGMNKTIGGGCTTESGILFIGSKEYDRYESRNKKTWLSGLRLMPQWDKTFAYSHWKFLRRCRRQMELKKSSSLIQNPESMKSGIIKNIPFSKSRKHQKEGRTNILALYFDRLKMSGFHSTKWKEWWTRLSSLILDVLLKGARIFLIFTERLVYWSRRMIEYFRKRSNK